MTKNELILYFAYGSNMSSKRFLERIPKAQIIGVACLKDYEFKCDKRSKDGSSKGNIAPKEGYLTWGVIFGLSADENALLDRVEKGYERKTLTVTLDAQEIQCEVYISNEVSAELPYDWYMNYIIEGAREHKLPDKYIRMLSDIRVKRVTYQQIQSWVKQNYGFVPQTCWIAHAKELSGLLVRHAPNRKVLDRVKPCPPEKVEPIQSALRHFGIIES